MSIGLPVYNAERYLEEALDSILRQTFEDFELVISDNASTDRTEAICRAYAARDPRVRYHRNEENLGSSANFNRVVHLARGPYFRWACHDDVLEPACVARCVEALDAAPPVVLSYPLTIPIDDDGRRIDQRVFLKSLRHGSSKPHERFEDHLRQFYPVGGQCNALFGVIRRDVLLRTALIDNYPSADRILLGELALYGQFHEVPEYLFKLRIHAANSTSVEVNPSVADLAAWIDPKNKGKLVLPHWRWLRGYAAAIARAPLSARERTKCCAALVRGYVGHNERELLREALVAARFFGTHLFSSNGAATASTEAGRAPYYGSQ